MNELKPAFRFVGIFLGLYFALNILYGFYISAYNPLADPLTIVVTRQSSYLLNTLGEETTTGLKSHSPAISIMNASGVAVSVFEGCNGINVMIVFVAFVMAFGAKHRGNSWFVPTGIAIIYFANLIRIMMLYYVAEYWRDYFYYMHKYILTAFLYIIVFLLWWWWIKKISDVKLKKSSNEKTA